MMEQQLILSVAGMVMVASVVHHALWRGLNGMIVKVGMVVVGVLGGVGIDMAKVLLQLLSVVP